MCIRKCLVRTALVLLLLALGPSPVDSQNQAAFPQSKSQIRTTTNEVIVPVTATDANGELVLNLEAKDFHVFDDGIEQTIDYWGLSEDPLAVALVIETSSRLRAMAPVIHSTGSIFTETVMALDGEAAVVTYDATVDVRQPFTQDHGAVQDAIAETKFEAPERYLYDAMAASVDLLKTRPTTRRRIMLLLAESQDDGSKAKLGQVLRDAEDANITIYAVGPSSAAADFRGGKLDPAPLKAPGLPTMKTTSGPYLDLVTPAFWLLERGTNEIKHHQLEVAAAATGGIHYRSFRESTFRTALDRIGGELHAQYILSYRQDSSRSVGFHKIEVKISKPGISVRNRLGYYVAPPVE
jgi:Ca-activated chloride channel family protein